MFGKNKKRNNVKIAFNEVYNRYVGLVLSIAKDILKDYNLSQDAAQETFIRVFKMLDTFPEDNEHKLKTWICIVARNVSIDMYRKQKREGENMYYVDGHEMDEIMNSEYDPLEKLTIKQLNEEIYSIIVSLDDTYKDVILLRYYVGLEYEQIADILKISLSNVKVRLHRAKKIIVQKMDDKNKQEVITNG